MSFSVDDLVSSFSGSHIGQEAMDLATLQSQLAQTLFAQQIQTSFVGQPASRDSCDMQPCNTPTSRTRSSSLSFGQMGDVSRQRHSSSITTPTRSRNNSISVQNAWGDMDEMDEDEAMVEDLLTPSSPGGAGVPMPAYAHQQAPARSQTYGGFTESPSSSLFTSTDPFYIAQMQALQNPPHRTNSAFAQAGRPSEYSPFIQHTHAFAC